MAWADTIANIRPFDYGNVLALQSNLTSDKIKNALMQQQIAESTDKQTRQRQVGNIFASNPNPDPGQVIAVDPTVGINYMNARSTQQVAGAEAGVKTAALRQAQATELDGYLAQIDGIQDPTQKMQMARFLLPKAQEAGLIDKNFTLPADIPADEFASNIRQLRASIAPMLKPQELPPDIQSANYLRAHPDLASTYGAMKRAGAPQTTVNLPPQEGAEAKAVGEAFGQQYGVIQKSGFDASNRIAKYDRLKNLLEGVATGKLTPAATDIAAFGQSFGFTVDPNLGPKQAAASLVNEMALQLRNPSGGAGMPGSLSDKDREFLQSMVPGLGTTPAGRELMIDTAKKLAQRDKEVAKRAREYRTKHGHMDEGFFNALDEWSAENPLFPAAAVLPANKPQFRYVPGQGLVPVQ